jgi:hypothetical protein
MTLYKVRKLTMESIMKNLLKVMITLWIGLQGMAFAEEWGTNHPSSASFRSSNSGWAVSTRPNFRPFEPIALPKVVIVPVIRNPNPNVYRERYGHFQHHYRHLERRSYR